MAEALDELTPGQPIKAPGVPVAKITEEQVVAVADAQPLPALPAEIKGASYAITVGLNFSLNR